MKKRMVTTGSEPGNIAWVLPNPVWNALVLGTHGVTRVYTVGNSSPAVVTILNVELVQGDDSRLNIVGGTCFPGLTLLPNTTCTIEIEASPRALGTVKQVLCINHSGNSSPLWIDIAFAIVRQPLTRKSSSLLVDETSTMERQRRLSEQDGHRRFARVNARQHNEEQRQSLAPEGEMQNNILQNPWLNSQRFDGVDPNLNPEPPLNSEARREFDNERREQEMEKQLRLGNMPKMSTAPKPPGY